MRFLVEPFALGALKRGRSIEQFLGPTDTPEQPGIRWAQLRPTAEGIALIVHEAMDVGDENHCDLGTFPCFGREDGEEDFGLQLAVVDDAHAALAIAEGRIGADRSRWVNEGVAGAEYRDYVRAGRPSAFVRGAARSDACPG
ncbi:hypothetical protein ACIRD2_06390 [Streptomyces sp. NPDC093595]|uniref:hypothetical protein n=1 Tax=Streptomyces sp. NPDC093595 TaxID=3366045 RepID=UPI00381B4213